MKPNENKVKNMCYPSLEEVQTSVIWALLHFYFNDKYLLDKNVHERSMTFRLGIYLQQIFPDWNVDCEYNKNVTSPLENKFLFHRCERAPEMDCVNCNKQKECTVFPDIIIHKRGTPQNLLVIEAKKAPAKSGKIDTDKKRLKII